MSGPSEPSSLSKRRNMPKDGESDILRQRLYVFDLPKELLESLALQGRQPEIHPEAQEDEKSTDVTDEVKVETEPSKATACSLCGLNFVTLQEQRLHVKSDLHNFNLKQKLRGMNPVSESEFDKLIGDLDESISGSDSSDSDSDNGDDGNDKDLLTSLLKKQAKISKPQEDEEALGGKQAGSPYIWLSSPTLPENTSLGIYLALLPSRPDKLDVIEWIRKSQVHSMTKPVQAKEKVPTVFLCMIGGGHFAGMVVSLEPKKVGRQHSSYAERQPVILASKTFHRYTTRRKQGGSQSASDGAKGKASSAGSSLRRANEAALNNEVRELLASWKQKIDDCALLFVRAKGQINHRTILGKHEGQVFTSKDTRLRTFPFGTRRATQSELLRAFAELTQIKISTINPKETKEAEGDTSSATSTKPKPKKAVQEKDPEAEARIMHTTQISSLVKRSKGPALLSYAQKNDIDLGTFEFFPESLHHHAPTALHLAASLGVIPIITTLLLKANVDPTIKNPDGKTASTIAKDRPSRDAFRVARHQLGEARWAWADSGVGAAMSPAEAKEREAQGLSEAEAGAQLEARRRREEVERLRREDEQKEDAKHEKRLGKGKTLAQQETGASKREAEARGLTPEMRMQLEREKRARAVEERLKRLQG